MALPTTDNLTRRTPHYAIPLIQNMGQSFPNTLTMQMKQQVASSIHSSDAHTRDEAANFILNICSDLDDVNSLLPI